GASSRCSGEELSHSSNDCLSSTCSHHTVHSDLAPVLCLLGVGQSHGSEVIVGVLGGKPCDVLPETHSIATRATPQSSLAGEVGSCSTGTEEAICRLAQGLLKSLDRSDITGVERAGLRTVQDVLNNPSQVCALTSPEAQWDLPG